MTRWTHWKLAMSDDETLAMVKQSTATIFEIARCEKREKKNQPAKRTCVSMAEAAKINKAKSTWVLTDCFSLERTKAARMGWKQMSGAAPRTLEPASATVTAPLRTTVPPKHTRRVPSRYREPRPTSRPQSHLFDDVITRVRVRVPDTCTKYRINRVVYSLDTYFNFNTLHSV